jgi:hypothetical protein
MDWKSASEGLPILRYNSRAMSADWISLRENIIFCAATVDTRL